MIKNQVAKNYLYNVSYQILLLILPLITTPYISRILGPDNIGIYSFTQAISQYFILIGSIGIALYGQREIAFVQKNKMKRSQIFWELIILRFFSIMISLVLFYFLIVDHSGYRIIFLILCIDIVASVFDIGWFLEGLEEFKKITIRNFIIRTICVAAIFLFVRNKDDLSIYVAINSLSLLLGNVSLWLYLPKLLTKIKISNLNIIKHLKPTLILFLPQIASSIYLLLDRTMLGIISSNSEVGFYDQAQKIIKMALSIVTSLGIVMMPRIASTFADKNNKKVFYYLNQAFRFVFLLSIPIMFGIMATAKNMVPWFFGDGYETVIVLLIITSPIIVIIALSNVLGVQYLLPTLRQKEYTISIVAGAIINFCLNLVLIAKFNSFGASFATVCAELSVTLVQFWYTRKEISVWETIKLSKNNFISGLIMLVFVYLLSTKLSSTILSTGLEVGIGIIIYLGGLLLLKDEFFIGIINNYIKKKL